MESEVSKSDSERPAKKLKQYPSPEHEDLASSELKKEEDGVDSLHGNDVVNGLAPTRKGRVSSSESSNNSEHYLIEDSTLCIQEEEVSSSASVANDTTVLQNHNVGNADSATSQEQDNFLSGNKDIKKKND